MEDLVLKERRRKRSSIMKAYEMDIKTTRSSINLSDYKGIDRFLNSKQETLLQLAVNLNRPRFKNIASRSIDAKFIEESKENVKYKNIKEEVKNDNDEIVYNGNAEDDISTLNIQENVITVGRLNISDDDEVESKEDQKNIKLPGLRSDNFIMPEYKGDDECDGNSLCTEEGNWMNIDAENESDSEEAILKDLQQCIIKRHKEEEEGKKCKYNNKVDDSEINMHDILVEEEREGKEYYLNDDIISEYVFDKDFDYESVKLQSKFGFNLKGEILSWDELKESE